MGSPRTAGGSGRRAFAVVAGALLLTLSPAACGPADDEPARSPEPSPMRSGAFADGGDIPVEHTCDGEDRPPPLEWELVHPDAVELVVIVDDPDAPGGAFTHWLVAGVSPADGALGESLPAGAVEGTNGFGEIGWAGPCPPPGDAPHTYRFEAVALAEPTGLAPGFTAAELAAAMEGNELSSAVLEGRYGR